MIRSPLMCYSGEVSNERMLAVHTKENSRSDISSSSSESVPSGGTRSSPSFSPSRVTSLSLDLDRSFLVARGGVTERDVVYARRFATVFNG